MRDFNVLFTCCSRLIHEQIESLRDNEDCANVKVYATNCNEDNLPLRSFVDGAYVVPPISDDAYLYSILKICEQKNIDIIIPTVTLELDFMAKHRKFFENKGIDREMKNEQNLTPLLYACSEGKLPIVKYLIEKQNVRTDATDQNKHDVLQLACRLGHLDIVEYLCEERSYGDFLKQNKYECSQCPLCIAAEAGQLNIVQYFVEKVGLDINQIDGYGMRPLLSACKSDITIVKYLCEKGANIDCFSNTGDSVLHIAC